MATFSSPDLSFVLQLFVVTLLIQDVSAREVWEEDWFKWTMGFVGVVIFVAACRLVNVCKRRARVRARNSKQVTISREKENANQTPGRPVSLPPLRRASQSSSDTSYLGNASRSRVVSAPPNTLEPVTQPSELPLYTVNAWSSPNEGWPANDALPPGYVINLSYNNNTSVPPLPPIARPSAQLASPSGPPPSYSSVVNEGNEHM